MKTKRLSRREFLRLTGAVMGGALFESFFPIPPFGHIDPAVSSPIKLFGWVKDGSGNVIPSGISVIDETWKEVGAAQTATDGYYEVTVPASAKISISAQSFRRRESPILHGYRRKVSRLPIFWTDKNDPPCADHIQVDFSLPPAAAVWIKAYGRDGTRLLMGGLYPQVSPPWYGPIHGIFPWEDFSLPVPTGPSIGRLSSAWHPEKASEQWEPYFAVPPGEPVYLMMLWAVPNVGTIPLRADNRGQGYELIEGEVKPVNIVYEFAETEYRRSMEKRSSYENQGVHIHGGDSGLAEPGRRQPGPGQKPDR